MFTADKRQRSLTPALRSLAPLCLGGCSRAGESLEAGTRSISTSSSITPLSWGARLPASLLVPGEMTAIMSPTDESSAGQNNTEMQTHTHTGSHHQRMAFFFTICIQTNCSRHLADNKQKQTNHQVHHNKITCPTVLAHIHTQTHTHTDASSMWLGFRYRPSDLS